MRQTKQIWAIKNHTPQLIRKVITFWDEAFNDYRRLIYNSHHQLILEIQKEFNSRNQLVQSVSLDGQGQLKSLLRFSYDANGNLIRKLFLDEGRQTLAVHEWVFTAKDRLICFRHFSGNGFLKHKIQYTYFNDGRLKEEKTYTANQTLKQVKSFAYHSPHAPDQVEIYNSHGQLLARCAIKQNDQQLPETQHWYDARGRLQRLESFSYFPDGGLKEEIVEDFFAGQKFHKIFNAKGNVLQVEHKQSSGQHVVEIFHYHSNGQKQSIEKFLIHNGQKQLIQRTIFSYDASLNSSLGSEAL